MRCIKAKFEDAERIRKELSHRGILSKEYKVMRDKKYVYFPILKEVKGYTLTNKNLEKSSKEISLKEALQTKLSAQELEKIKTSMDVIGDIAILEIDESLRKKSSLIANTLLSTHKKIKTVVRKSGEHHGVFRIQDYEYLAGKKTFETVHKENGVLFFLDIRKAYFSPRLSTDRLRISKEIKKGEEVLVLFSGIGTYPLVFAKNSKAASVYGIEINPDACAFAEKNLLLNKTKNIFLYCGDAREVASHFGKKFDRILMPLPYDAEAYFSLLPRLSKKGTLIHYYTVAPEEEFSFIKKKVLSYFPQARIKKIVKCGQLKPRTFRISVDFTF